MSIDPIGSDPNIYISGNDSYIVIQMGQPTTERTIKCALNSVFLGMNEELVCKLPIKLLEQLNNCFDSAQINNRMNSSIISAELSEAILRIFFAKTENDFVLSLKNQCLKWINESSKYDCPLSPKQISCALKIYLPKGLRTRQLNDCEKQHATQLIDGIHYM